MMKSKLLSCFCMVWIWLSPGLCPGQPSRQPALIDFTIRPYIQWVTPNSIHILWETDQPGRGWVEFAQARYGGDTLRLDHIRHGAGTEAFHKVRLDSLLPATKYFYRTVTEGKDGQRVYSPVRPFRTALADEQGAITFGVVGDTQISSENPDAWKHVAASIWPHRPDFVIHVGDLVSNGHNQQQWRQDFFGKASQLMATVPVYSVLGNHEDDAPYYYQYMINPSPAYYYTFHYGSVQFFMLDSNRDLDINSEQYKWLEKALAASKASWKVVVHHHPVYSSDENDFGDAHFMEAIPGHGFVQSLVALYDRYAVDAVFYGHIHSYERTWGIRNGQVDENRGTIYIQTGGGGGSLEHAAPTRSWFTAQLKTDHHYCMVAASPQQFTIRAYDQKGVLFDQHTIFRHPEDQIARETKAGLSPPILRTSTGMTTFMDTISLHAHHPNPAVSIRYTLDGRVPDQYAPLMQVPVVASKSQQIQVKAFLDTLTHADAVSLTLHKKAPLKSLSGIKPASLDPGLRYTYYQDSIRILPLPDTLRPVKSGIAPNISNEGINLRRDYYALRFSGLFYADETRAYQFYTYSGDGTRLFIGGQLVVDNNGSHQPSYQYGEIVLQKGFHRLELDYFHDRGLQHLEAGIVENNQMKTDRTRLPLDKDKLFHLKN